MAKKKLKAMQEIDGKQGIEKYRSLDEIIGGQQQLFGCKSLEQYEAKIKEMDIADLQEHALDCELRPIDNRMVLTERLVGEFRKKLSRYTNTMKVESSSEYNKETSSKLKKLLADGK